MASVEILMPRPIRPVAVEILERQFALHRAYQSDDFDAAVANVADRVRGLAVGPDWARDAAFIDRFPGLEVIAFYGVGYDAVDVAHAAGRGIMVTNTPDILTEEVADVAIGLMIMTARELGAAERHLRDGRWVSEEAFPFTRGTLREKTLGILGLGRIGKAVARRAEAFGLRIVYHGRRRQDGVPYRYFADLEDMARAADILLIAAPGGIETRNLVDAGVMAALGPDGILINIGRGSLVDEEALVAALNSGTILAAGLDVYRQEPAFPTELIKTGRAVLLPHVASASVHTRDLMARLVADNLVSWFNEGVPLTPVPECADISRRR